MKLIVLFFIVGILNLSGCSFILTKKDLQNYKEENERLLKTYHLNVIRLVEDATVKAKDEHKYIRILSESNNLDLDAVKSRLIILENKQNGVKKK